MIKRIFSFIITVIILTVSLCACSQNKEKNKYTSHSMDYFDTVTTITGYEYSQEEFDLVSEEILNSLGEYHRLYSIYHRFEGVENLCTINELVGGEHRTVSVDRRIIDMLLFARELYYKTDGIMNIAMGSVLSLWHNYRTIGKDNPADASLPPTDKLVEASEHCDITRMVIDEKNNTVTLTDPMMTLDVGAVAKGYAVECVAKELESRGITGYVLNVGGNVRTIGARADGTPWKVGIENPDGGDYLSYLGLNGQALVTSGSYQRFYYVDGKPYHHIIHPETLMPAVGFTSVSVVCNDSGLADALSTALFCVSQEIGAELISSFPGAEALWVTQDGEIISTSGWGIYEE